MIEETKHDLFLKRMQITVAILAGITTLILGIYNVKKNVFSKNNPEETSVKAVQTPPPQSPEKIRSALDEVGATWIKKLAAKNSGSN